MIISDRDVFVGAHLTPDVKEALRAEATAQKTSMSELVFKAIVQMLRAKGHKVSE